MLKRAPVVMYPRVYSWQDKLWMALDEAARVLWAPAVLATSRNTPAASVPEAHLSATDKQTSIRLLCVDHAGEIAAQALYQGQAFVAQCLELQKHLKAAAQEEQDHLVWCANRLKELSGRVSYFNPLWYGGSFLIGAVAGLAGDRWSLGFVAETEHQVIDHLESHLLALPSQDRKSYAILLQMQDDERHHATTALQKGAPSLPWLARMLMRGAAMIMTKTAYWGSL